MSRNNFSRATIPRPFGAANWVTAARAVYAVCLLGYGVWALAADHVPGPTLRWFWVVGALGALALDGVDGRLARRLGQTSGFGARFDMETDAATMLGLSLLAWLCDQAGPWVLAIGLARYIFVAGSRVFPALAAPLPPKKRRQAICVAQVAVLVLAVVPGVPPEMASPLCLGALAALVYSFAVDVVWLATSRAVDENKGEKKEAVV
ncbi:MAG TPA: CDP-alcohol phosphatidyltransferase family protein [Stellaceae bacterium]|nr:CDP-alcohol phosphatidyltransferase family protein [Stellaceae bacterium]